MLTRYFTAIGILVLLALIWRTLLNPQQKRSIDQFTRLFAKLLLIISLLIAAWALLNTK
ncbi:protein MIGRI [Kingella negevensis]|uniref:protein MIGRI n=1 Tax=Kingella negevensis TaxID=1522312 RepID=UPI000B04A9FF|nr:DUF2568 domain-containing protein [Kingella negevensis]MDK4679529.1 DUF2568 domain-containing protein [Kingella negevensis]MDK4682753.1 DUF2568 domain-containing protein [Kingella negevensis]MDK4685095.1 DUF2568 domain-containing protein [Kingella negevensis]MDK4688972.1 DUF2568 domain-containing protein [Kingella negevensis]MDK4690950.1 DUF2568 domain-containing protein [Kingella negevensis]